MNLKRLFGGDHRPAMPEKATPSDELATQGPGAWVLFKQRITPADIGNLLKLQRLSNLQGQDVSAALTEIAADLMPFVVDWNWKDEYGQPLPRPGEGDISLDLRELMWLMDQLGQRFQEVQAAAIPLGTTSASWPRSGAEAGRPRGGTAS